MDLKQKFNDCSAVSARQLAGTAPAPLDRFARCGRIGATVTAPRTPIPARAVARLVLAVGLHFGVATASATQRFQADEWITECDQAGRGVAADCSITVPFWQAQRGQKGSFALVVMLPSGNLGIVGQPYPTRAVLRVDKNPAIECRQTRYCIFPPAGAAAAIGEMGTGSLILIDVYTARGEFSFSLTPKGYQAGIAQIRAWGYRRAAR
jgi:hypothetical protein